MANNPRSKIRTPHAAVIVWNYDDRISAPKGSAIDASGTDKKYINAVSETIISTLSCVSIQTNKDKGKPDGSFNLVLAPFKNWVSTITAGSWCAILMSNEPITEADLKQANKQKVKMIGKIETVRVQTEMQQDGSRRTLYYVSGTDWGHIFNSTVYIDNLIANESDPQSQGNAAAVALRNLLFAKDGTPKSFLTQDNMRSIMDIFGKTVKGFDKVGSAINRLAGVKIYNFNIPQKMAEYFKFVDAGGKPLQQSTQLNKLLALITGYLKSYDDYTPSNEAMGYIDPFSLQGMHSFWQILLDNSNPALNEMYSDLRWSTKPGDNSVSFALYNRIKPFAYKGYTEGAGATSNIRSFFQNVRTHNIESDTVISINAGTNWRDKYNFIEIKPTFQDFNIISNWTKQKSQAYDITAFDREGFRPLIVDTRQFPTTKEIKFNPDLLQGWLRALREWYFDTHRLLNGSMVMTGINEYIAVGDNIRVDAALINPTANMNTKMLQSPNNTFLLAHVESISHRFTVDDSGARQYRTTINFVRGVIVDSKNVAVGNAAIDKYANSLTPSDDRNRVNTISTSTETDPDPQKVRGT